MSFPIGPFRRLPLGGGAKISPFLPLSFPNLELYLDSRLGVSSFADGANVTTWPDQSGHSPGQDAIHNLIDPTMGRTGSNLTPRGTPSVVFQVADDTQGLQCRTAKNWTPVNTRGYTIYYYGKTLSKTVGGNYFFVNQNVFSFDSANFHVQHVQDTGGTRNYGLVDDAGGGNPHKFGTTASISGNWALQTLVLPPPNNNTVPCKYYVNAVQIAQTGGPANYVSTQAGVSGYALGNTTNFNIAFRGNIGAYFIFSDNHSDATIALFNLWASLFFGLT